MAASNEPEHGRSEWIEADGLRTRRYHALLLAATAPPAGRFVLVNGFDAEVETAEGRFALSTQRYAPGVDGPDGPARLGFLEIDEDIDLFQDLIAHCSLRDGPIQKTAQLVLWCLHHLSTPPPHPSFNHFAEISSKASPFVTPTGDWHHRLISVGPPGQKVKARLQYF